MSSELMIEFPWSAHPFTADELRKIADAMTLLGRMFPGWVIRLEPLADGDPHLVNRPAPSIRQRVFALTHEFVGLAEIKAQTGLTSKQVYGVLGATDLRFERKHEAGVTLYRRINEIAQA